MPHPPHPPPRTGTGDSRGDAAVIARSVGSPEEFGVIFDRHAPHLHRYLARRVGRQAADDLLAETFTTAFGKRGRYDHDRADARPWLYGIATRLVGQHRRDEARQLRLHLAVPPPEQVDNHADRAVAVADAHGMRAAVGTALHALSPGDRDVLLLVAWANFSYEEVAAALDVPVGTVRSRLHRARRQVRDRLTTTTTTPQECHHG